MCPCSIPKDIPQEGEGSEENEQVENGFEILSGESGSDEEQDGLADQGYVPLAQSEDETVIPDVIEEEEEAPVYIINELDEEPIQPEPEAVKLNNDTPSSSCAFSSTRESRMGEDEIDFIKSVMMNIKLPSSSIPEWAKRIPEEKWKAPLVSSLQQGSSGEEKSTDKKSS